MLKSDKSTTATAIWKRRYRTAPSAPQDWARDKEVVLSVRWSGPRPTSVEAKDKLLFAIWAMKSELEYEISCQTLSDSKVGSVIVTDKKEALAVYRDMSKKYLTRSKEVDYGWPLFAVDRNEEGR
jgi:hypothetical protein